MKAVRFARSVRPLVAFGLVLLLLGPVVSILPDPVHQLSPVGPSHASNPNAPTGEGPGAEGRSAGGRTSYIDLSPAEPSFGLDPSGVVNASFTLRERNNVGVSLASASWRVLTLQGEEIDGERGPLACDMHLEGLGSLDWSIDIDASSDLHRECMALGWDRLRIVVTLRGIDDGGSDILVSCTVPLHLTQRVAMLVDEDLYPLIKDGLDRYEDDAGREGSVEFLTRTGRWASAESVRALLKLLWRDEGITGAILWGYLPSAMWKIVHSEGNIETFTIPIFYEDLDGTFRDTDNDGYYDKHGWGENDGPEIWVSLMMPPRTTVPATHLDPYGHGTGGGLLGKYYDSDHLTHLNLTRVDPTIEFFWEWQCPEQLDMEDFSVEWTGRIKADVTDTYTLSLYEGGGNRVWVDGVLVVDEMYRAPFARTERLVDFRLTEGWHPIRIEHYENGWGYNWTSAIHLMWSSDAILARSINDYLDTAHAFHTGTLDYPERALLFMDHCYGYQCRMLEPVKGKLVDPLYGDRIVVGGGETSTSGSDYVDFLGEGYELVSVWSHAGSAGHWMNSPDRPEDESASADSWMVRRTEAGLVTLIWGCHAGDYESKGADDTKLSENLAANYAFSTPHGLASLACTRSYGTTFDNVYWAWGNGSSMATGYFAYKDRVYDQDLQARNNPQAIDRWVDDEVMFGDPFLRLDHRPDDLWMSIEGVEGFTTDPSVTITLGADGATEMRFSDQGGEWSRWEPFCTTKEWDLGTALGTHRVYFQARNSWGVSRFLATDVITLVSAMSDHVSVEVNGGEELTNSSKLYLSLDGGTDDAAGLLVSLRDDASGWSGWEPFARELTWELTKGDGPRTVHARFSDEGGIWMAEATDSIVVDTRAPATTATVDGTLGATDWYLSNVTVELVAEDVLSGVARILHSIDGGPWAETTGTISIDEDGEHVLRYRATDVAGNMEEVRESIFKVDRASPQELRVALAGGGDHVGITSVLLDLAAEDPASGVESMSLRVDGGEWGRWMDFKGSYRLTLPFEDGCHEIGLIVMDRAGNVAEPATFQVYLDRRAPCVALASPEDGAVDVPTETVISVTFDEAVDPVSVLEGRLLVQTASGEVLKGTVSYDEESFMLTFAPDGPMDLFTDHVVMLMGGICDLAGNPLNGGGCQGWQFRTVGVGPGAPGGLAIEAYLGALLTWDPPMDGGSAPVTGYNVYRMVEVGPSQGFVLIETVEDAFFHDTGAEEGVTYRYRVTAITEIGEGPASEEASILVPGADVDEPEVPELPDGQDDIDPDPLPQENDGDVHEVTTGAGVMTAMMVIAAISSVTVAALLIIRRRTV